MSFDIQGLDPSQVDARLAQFGPNIFDQVRPRHLGQVLAEILREPMFLLMLGAAGLYLVLGGVAEGAFLTLAAFATVALVLVQEVRSERALRALRDLAEPTARVIRGGVETKIPARNLVPGDVLLVGEGQRLPADCRLIAGEVLAVDESALTGESAPVTKFPDPGADQVAAAVSSAQLFAGTLVVQGQGVARVELTGGRTTFGQIGISLAAIDYSPTPLQKASGRMVRWIGGLGLGFCVLVVVAYGVIRGDWLEGGLAGITIAISLIPEEFPMVLAIFLALGAWRLAQGRVLVRRSAAIEALGGATVLCVDKTGTLTENRMSLERLWTQGQTYRGIWAQMPVQAQQVLEAAVMASAARPTDPMDRALWAQVSPDRPRREPAKIWPLQKDRLAVVQVWPAADLGAGIGYWAAAKGAPETIFEMCHLPPDQVAALEVVLRDWAAQGLRILAVATTSPGHASLAEPETMVFEFRGLVGFLDPVRADVPKALAQARQAGIKVMMITGDYPATALAIARQAGIDTQAGALTGQDLATLSHADLQVKATTVRVFARVKPQQKLALVEALKAGGEVVAMTGDGVNDAPALQSSHIGIAMGVRGTDVAREAAELVLLDDQFASIVSGIALGRRIFANLRKALAYVVAIHVPIAGLALLPVLLGLPPLLYPMHVVVLELIIDPLCALVFEAEPGDVDAMHRPPRAVNEPLFGAKQISLAVSQGLGVLVGVFGLYVWALNHGPAPQARAEAFIALILCNLVLALVNSAAVGLGIFASHRRPFWIIALGAVTALTLALTVPGLPALFRFALPSGLGLTLALSLAALAALWGLGMRRLA